MQKPTRTLDTSLSLSIIPRGNSTNILPALTRQIRHLQLLVQAQSLSAMELSLATDMSGEQPMNDRFPQSTPRCCSNPPNINFDDLLNPGLFFNPIGFNHLLKYEKENRKRRRRLGA